MSASWPLVFAIALVSGAALFGVGTALLRSTEPAAAPTWTALVTGDDAPVPDAERREMIARLELVDADWARKALALARAQEPSA